MNRWRPYKRCNTDAWLLASADFDPKKRRPVGRLSLIGWVPDWDKVKRRGRGLGLGDRLIGNGKITPQRFRLETIVGG